MYKCIRCGKKLKIKESIERGFGKYCYKLIVLNEENNITLNNFDLN